MHFMERSCETNICIHKEEDNDTRVMFCVRKIILMYSLLRLCLLISHIFYAHVSSYSF